MEPSDLEAAAPTAAAARQATAALAPGVRRGAVERRARLLSTKENLVALVKSSSRRTIEESERASWMSWMASWMPSGAAQQQHRRVAASPPPPPGPPPVDIIDVPASVSRHVLLTLSREVDRHSTHARRLVGANCIEYTASQVFPFLFPLPVRRVWPEVPYQPIRAPQRPPPHAEGTAPPLPLHADGTASLARDAAAGAETSAAAALSAEGGAPGAPSSAAEPLPPGEGGGEGGGEPPATSDLLNEAESGEEEEEEEVAYMEGEEEAGGGAERDEGSPNPPTAEARTDAQHGSTAPAAPWGVQVCDLAAISHHLPYVHAPDRRPVGCIGV